MEKTNLAGRAGSWSSRNWKKALFGWLGIALIAVVVGTAVGTKTLTEDQMAPGETARAVAMLNRANFKEPPVEEVLVQSRTLTAEDSAFRATIADLDRRLSALSDVIKVATPVGIGKAGGALSADRHSLLVDVTLTKKSTVDSVASVVNTVAQTARAHRDLKLFELGDLSANRELNKATSQDFQTAEVLSIPVTLAIMLVAFGALVAAGLPVLLAFSAVLAALGMNAAVSHVFPASDVTSSVLLLVGMAVGVDYSLFYLRREREERAAGNEPRAALLRTASTSGQAVLVSGATVLISMAGMLLSGTKIFQSVGLATMIVVLAAMIGSLTVLPALLSRLGDRVEKGRVPFLHRDLRQGGDSRVWGALLRPVLSRPLLAVIVSVAVLATLAIPAASMKTQLPSVADMPSSLNAVKAYDAISEAFPGAQSPAIVVLGGRDLRSTAATRAIALLRAEALKSKEMFDPIDVRMNRAGTIAAIQIPLAGNGTDDVSQHALSTLRKTIVPRTVAALPGASVAVTGQTAGTADFNKLMAERTPYVFAFVLGLAFLLLLVTFRSIVIPLKAIFLNLLSVGASYGVLVATFQWGWGQSLLGFRSSGTTVSWLPLFLFVILFGLSMDYHVFILSRIKELVDRGVSTEEAVSRSIVGTAGTVTAAAVVMVAVFAMFVGLREIELKEAGFGLAVAILIDATIIRGILLPSAMKLLGRWNWYLPRWLGWLPVIRFERHARPELVAVTE